MICPRCGKRNTENAKRCRYCGCAMAPTENHRPRVSQNRTPHRKRKHSRTLPKVAIALLAVALVIVTCIVFIHSDKQRVSITDFKADGVCFAAGEHEVVIFSSKASSSPAIFLNNEKIGLMHDDGRDGDEKANDGIYSYSIIAYSDEEKTETYYAGFKNPSSEAITLYYYDQPTEEEIQYFENTTRQIEALNDSLKNNGGYIDVSNIDLALATVKEYSEQLVADGAVAEYRLNADNVYIRFSSGLPYLYIPNLEGFLTSGNDIQLSIITCQPHREEFNTANLNDIAYEITGNFSNCSLYARPENELVTAQMIKSYFSSDQIILWFGHGSYDILNHSYLITGESSNNFLLYTNDLLAQRMCIATGGRLAVNSKFIDKYCGRMDNSLVYLNCCLSGKTDTLAKSFLNKGAAVVACNTDTIKADYGHRIQIRTMDKMQYVNPDTGNYYTFGEALEFAKEEFGRNDSDYGGIAAETIIIGNQDYRLANKSSDKEPSSYDWSTAYRDFVLNKKFLNYGDSTLGYGELENGAALITFALHDMNSDTVPELIIFNGFNGRDLQANYVFTYTGTEVVFCGKTLASAYAVDGYPGLFSSVTSSGFYLEEQYTGQFAEVTYLDYHALYGNVVTKESVSVTGLPISSSGRLVISRTANDTLYEAGQRPPQSLPGITWQELNSKGWDAFIRQYSGEETEIPAQVEDTSWSSVCERFVVDEEFLSNGLSFSGDPNSQPRFSLYDLDQNGVPELLAANGFGPMTGAKTYVFTCKDGRIQYVGSLREASGYPFRYEDSSYPGIFAKWGEGTFYQQLYYEMNGEELVEIPVRTVAMTENLMQTSTSLTADQALYDYVVSCEESDKNQRLFFYSLSEIRTMGWEAFVQAESPFGLVREPDTEEKTIVYSGYSTQFGPSELSVDARAGIGENKNIAILCAMLSDAAYSDGGTQLALLYRDMFEGTYCDQRFDYSDRSFCSGIALGEKVINGERTNVLVITIKGTKARFDISSLDIDISEIFADTNLSKTEYKGYQAYTSVVEFERRILSLVNELLADNIDRMDLNRPLKIIVTGHSLGGAAANLIGATYTNGSSSGSGWWAELANCEDIYCYTFAAINALDGAGSRTSFPISDGYENIHNIVNSYDEMVAVSNVTRVHGLSDGKFGHNDWINEDFRDNMFNLFENHQMYRYLESVDRDLVNEK